MEAWGAKGGGSGAALRTNSSRPVQASCRQVGCSGFADILRIYQCLPAQQDLIGQSPIPCGNAWASAGGTPRMPTPQMQQATRAGAPPSWVCWAMHGVWQASVIEVPASQLLAALRWGWVGVRVVGSAGVAVRAAGCQLLQRNRGCLPSAAPFSPARPLSTPVNHRTPRALQGLRCGACRRGAARRDGPPAWAAQPTR